MRELDAGSYDAWPPGRAVCADQGHRSRCPSFAIDVFIRPLPLEWDAEAKTFHCEMWRC